MNDLENETIVFEEFEENETMNSKKSLMKPRLQRRGRPPHNPSEPIRNERRANNKPHRDIQRNVMANKGNQDLAPWSQNAFCLPSAAHERFERAGYVTLFCPLDDMSLRSRESEGWLPVPIEEVPEWIVSSIPTMSQHQDLYRRYVICIDQLLMKIPNERYEQLRLHVEKERNYASHVINRARDNSTVNPLAMNQGHALSIAKNRS